MGNELAVTDVALVVTLKESHCDSARQVDPIGSQQSAQNDRGYGVLPLTKTNFMRRPSTCRREPKPGLVGQTTWP
jgi:hypothetical protein